MQQATIGWAVIVVFAWLTIPLLASICEWWRWLYRQSDWPRIQREYFLQEEVAAIREAFASAGIDAQVTLTPLGQCIILAR